MRRVNVPQTPNLNIMKSEKLDFAFLVLLLVAISYLHALRIENKNDESWKNISREKISKQKVETSSPRVTLTKFQK